VIALFELIVNVFEALGLLVDFIHALVWLGEGAVKAWCWVIRR
jgi:hypothetical protein